MDDDEWDCQEAWGQAWTSSDEEEQKKGDFSCRLCGEDEPDLYELMSHNQVHLRAPPYRCNVCPFFSNEISILKVHMRGHVKENQQTWEQTKITSQKGQDFNWLYDEPTKPPPRRTRDTLYISGLRLVPGKSKEVNCNENIHSSSDDDEDRYQEEQKLYESSPGSNQYFEKLPDPKEGYPVKLCEPEVPQVKACEKHHMGERRISSLFEKCPNSEDENSCQVPQHLQERGRRVAPPPTEGRSGKPKKFPPVRPPPSTHKPFIPFYAKF